MAGGGSIPGPFPLRELPAAWRAVDFISDLHLCAAMPLTWQAWARHLQSTDADALFILGDLFEVWVGDDARERLFERSCVEALAAASRRLPIFFLQGNRDFLVGESMCADCRMEAIHDPTALQAWGTRVLVSHGDALCLADVDYQQFRQWVRSAQWQQDFLARPLPERLQIAARLRSESRSRQAFDGMSGADVDARAAQDWLDAAGATLLVHGHTHRPGRHELPGGGQRLVLSDWDLDDSHRPRAEVLRWTAAGFERRPPSGSS